MSGFCVCTFKFASLFLFSAKLIFIKWNDAFATSDLPLSSNIMSEMHSQNQHFSEILHQSYCTPHCYAFVQSKGSCMDLYHWGIFFIFTCHFISDELEAEWVSTESSNVANTAGRSEVAAEILGRSETDAAEQSSSLYPKVPTVSLLYWGSQSVFLLDCAVWSGQVWQELVVGMCDKRISRLSVCFALCHKPVVVLLKM